MWLWLLACVQEKPTESLPLEEPIVVKPAVCPQDLPGATCGRVELPETEDSGRRITLSTAVFPATVATVGPPLVLFTGGPGADVFDLAGLFGPSGPYASLNEDRDLVLFSERGSFGATPFLGCPELADVDAVFQEPDDVRFAVELEAYGRCHDRLVGAGVNLAAFNNARRAADVPLVLGALGYTEWYLWGVSGGALLAQTVLRDHPQGVAGVMLDSGGFSHAHMAVVATDLLANAQDRFDRLYAECAADSACSAAFPDLEARLHSLVATLEATPRRVSVTHPGTGVTAELALDGDLLLQLYTGNMASVAYLPLVTALAEGGDFSLIEPSIPAARVADAAANSAAGLYLSTFCADLGETLPSEVDRAGVDADLDQALSGALENLFSACERWDVPARGPGGPVASTTIPLLVMEGLYDTNRRPDEGAVVAAQFSTAYLAEYHDRGHVVLDDCAASMMRQFMADPTTAPLSRCVPQKVTWVTGGG